MACGRIVANYETHIYMKIYLCQFLPIKALLSISFNGNKQHWNKIVLNGLFVLFSLQLE